MKKKLIDWPKEQKRFNRENLKSPLTIKDYCKKYGLNYTNARNKIKQAKARQVVSKFQDATEEEYLKKKQN